MPNYYIVRTRDEVESYVKKGVSAIGWSEVDFSQYQSTEELCDAVRNKYYNNSNCSKRNIGRKIGEVRRFKNICKGDIVLVPCYKGFYIGRATGGFKYDIKALERDLSNQIMIDYITKDGAPTMFSRDGKLTSLSSKLGVRGFTVLSITDEAIIREINDLLSFDNDYSYRDKVVELESKEATEFQKKLIETLSNYGQTSLKAGGRGFEELIAAMLKKDGFDTRILSKKVGGSGEADADVLAIKRSSLGDEFTTAYYIQAKHYSGLSDNGITQIVQFKRDQEQYENEHGVIFVDGISLGCDQIKYVLVSSGEFTEYVKNMAAENGIILIDRSRLSEILFNVIDDLPDIRYQLGFIKKYEHI